MKRNLQILLVVFISSFLLCNCNRNGNTSSDNNSTTNNENSDKSDSKKSTEKEYSKETSVLEFNLQDKDAISSGNIPVAYEKIAKVTPEYVLKNIYSSSITKITKSPYSHLGKFVKLYGNVYKVEELPPDDSRPGTWAEALLLVDNPNSPFGTTTVDFFYNGNIDKINANTYSTVAGYFCGTYSTTNAFGGEVEVVTMVGNYCNNGLR
jgi:hypothetical protein